MNTFLSIRFLRSVFLSYPLSYTHTHSLSFSLSFSSLSLYFSPFISLSLSLSQFLIFSVSRSNSSPTGAHPTFQFCYSYLTPELRIQIFLFEKKTACNSKPHEVRQIIIENDPGGHLRFSLHLYVLIFRQFSYIF